MKNFQDFQKVDNSNENEKLREANISLNESVESSLGTLDVPSITLYLEYNIFIDNSVEATSHVFYDVGLIDRVEKKVNFLRSISRLLRDKEEKLSSPTFRKTNNWK